MIKYRGKTYTISKAIDAIKARLWKHFSRKIHKHWFYPYFFRSTWHALLHPASQKFREKKCFYTAIPTQGAGIGHQLANWNSGMFCSKTFCVPYAHSKFSSAKWEEFFGFSEQLPDADDLVRTQGYKKRTLPGFRWNSDNELKLQQAIIDSYAGKKILLVAERNQPYKEQYGVIPELKHYFGNATARKRETLRYDPDCFNIAVHVRRTVIIDSKVIHEDEASRKKRWLSDDYYLKIIHALIESARFPKPISIYIFSTEDLPEFRKLGKDINVCSCHEWDEYTSFLHLVRADLLVTSKSSFSYKAALFGDGYKICPKYFWHDYPDSQQWILAENDGKLDQTLLDFR
jgi:hypothetical protein